MMRLQYLFLSDLQLADVGKLFEFTGYSKQKLIFYSNFQSGGTAIAQLNLSLSVRAKILSIGTSALLHQATEILGSI